MNSEAAPLDIQHDAERDVVTICGIAYAGDLFRALGFGPIGTVLRIDKRADGVVTLTRAARSERF